MNDFRYSEQQRADILRCVGEGSGEAVIAHLEVHGGLYHDARRTGAASMVEGRELATDLEAASGRTLELFDVVFPNGIWLRDGNGDHLFDVNRDEQRALVRAVLEQIRGAAKIRRLEYEREVELRLHKRDPDVDEIRLQAAFAWHVIAERELGTSSNGENRRGGPMIRFLTAALAPVLGDSTPKPETLRDFINNIRAPGHWLKYSFEGMLEEAGQRGTVMARYPG